MADDIVVNSRVTLRREELVFRATRSGGPGGQHVNTSSTRVELRWDVAQSTAIDDTTRALLLERLASRLDGTGTLRLVEQGARSQFRNREVVTERLARLVADALVERRARKPTKPTRASKEARLAAKRRRSATKRERRTTDHD